VCAAALAGVKAWPAHFIEMPLIRQATAYTCGCAATASVLNYWTNEEWPEMELAKILKADDKDGTRYREIADFGRRRGYKVDITQNTTLAQLFALIDKKTPPIVLLQAWPDKPVDWKTDWDDGHYAVALGYDDKNVYFMDPSTTGHYTWIPHGEFMDRWHDIDGASEKVVQFALVLSRSTKPAYDFTKIDKMG